MIKISIVLMFSLNVFYQSSYAADIDHGKILHKGNCQRCHQSDIYTRDNRKVKTFSELQKQVGLCDQAIGLTWFDEDIDDVVEYLNQKYYKFKHIE